MSKVLAALAEIQGANLELKKDSTNPAFKSKYASLGAVLDVVVPALTERGMLLIQSPGITDAGPALFTTVCDPAAEDGPDSIESVTPLILDKTTMQGMGSAITYARRYALVSMFNLDAEDDDGNEASKPAESTPRRATPSPRRSR